MSSLEKIPATDLGGNSEPPVTLYPRTSEVNLTAAESAHVDLWSQGYTVSECAQILGIGVDEANEILSSAKKRFGARNRRQMLTMAIQNGSVSLQVNPNPSFPALSRSQDNILHLLALGWSPPEIRAEHGISDSTIETHTRGAKTRLDAKNVPHLIRRSFEENIFKIGEPLAPHVEAEEDTSQLLRVSVEDITLSTEELGMKTQYEIEIIKIMGSLGIGYFNGGTMSRYGFAPQASSQNHRFKLYREAATKVQRKLNSEFGKTILDSLALSSNYRYYFAPIEIAIGTPDNMRTIKPVGVDDLPKPGSNRIGYSIKQPPRSQKKPAAIIKQDSRTRTSKPRANEITTTPVFIENPYLEMENLPELNEALFNQLVPRPAPEVLDSRDVWLALRYIMKSEQAPFDYWTKVVIALRYGEPSTQTTIVNRRQQSVRLEEIMKFVPRRQGIDTDSTSLITGLKPEAILETELAFLNKHRSQFPQFEPLIGIVSKELEELRKQTPN